ncbi:uncharacterized protein LOC116731107 isoform X2 [Xiphophorus hellerii]|uniref:uncharacterized protein LOC116731107 isoform X2 n=1 Tax=Xiphophorus hellerii TaxID=8084 RepID=UPI0013B42AE5|nr:uncharacterized protein LOC116731107 isoform X2 [Xiphophorus hellerii]
MAQEVDREKYDPKWGIGPWIALSEQIDGLITYLGEHDEFQTDGDGQKIQNKLKGLVEMGGGDLLSRQPLGKHLLQGINNSKKHLIDTMQKEGEAGVFTNRSCKTNEQNAERELRQREELLVFWQGLSHAFEHKKQKVATSSEHTNINTDNSLPPPYSGDETRPSQGIYPIVNITQGTLAVEGETATPQNAPEVHTGTDTPNWTILDQTPSTPNPMAWSQLNDTFVRSAQRLQNLCDRAEQMERGEIKSNSAKNVQIKMDANGTWVSEENLTDKTDELREVYHISCPLESMRGLGLHTAEGQHALVGSNTGAYPLLKNSTEGQKYVPFPLDDREAIVDKLPSITAGGSLWLAELDLLTSGMTLALGDFRAIMSRAMSGMVMRDIEHAAGTQNVSNSTPAHQFITPLAREIKRQFPLATIAPITRFEWDYSMDPKEYINKAAETWFGKTTINPKGPHSNLTEMFREAILKGVPEQVVQSIRNNPDLTGCEHVRWERHLLHHLIKAQDEFKKKQSDTKDLEIQLLKLQLQEAKQKLKKKTDKKEHVMVNATSWQNTNQIGEDWFLLLFFLFHIPKTGTERFLVGGEGVWPVTRAVLRGGVVGRGSGDHSRRTYATDVDVLDTGQNIAGPYQITGNQV